MDTNIPEISQNENLQEDPLLSKEVESEPEPQPRKVKNDEVEYEDESEEDGEGSEEDVGQKIYDPLNIQPDWNNKALLEVAKAKLQLKHANDTSFEYEGSSDEGEEYDFAEQPFKEEQPKEKQVGMFISGGVCCMVFTFSVILWVVLFADLTHRANVISAVVEHTPTLDVYYNMYREFFDEFYASKQSYDNTENMLKLKDNSDLMKYKRSILAVLNAESQLNHNIKSLHKSVQHKRDVQTYADTVKSIISSASELEADVTIVKNQHTNFTGFYTDVLKNIQALYAKAFQLIDLYGKYYINTNRIWVSTENIYQLFDRRAREIQKEGQRKHFNPIQQSQKNVNLTHFDFQAGALVSSLEALHYESQEELFLSCFVRTEVNNPDLKYLDRSFSLTLGVNNHNPLATSNTFTYGVTEKFNRISFHQALTLPPGKNSLQLYAKLNKGDLELNYISVECLVFEQYADIPVYGVN